MKVRSVLTNVIIEVFNEMLRMPILADDSNEASVSGGSSIGGKRSEMKRTVADKPNGNVEVCKLGLFFIIVYIGRN